MLPMNKNLSFAGADLVDWSDDKIDSALEQVRAEYAVSLPGAGFSLWTSPIETTRRGPTEFCSDWVHVPITVSSAGRTLMHEFLDGSILAWFDAEVTICFYWMDGRVAA